MLSYRMYVQEGFKPSALGHSSCFKDLIGLEKRLNLPG